MLKIHAIVQEQCPLLTKPKYFYLKISERTLVKNANVSKKRFINLNMIKLSSGVTWMMKYKEAKGNWRKK